jgi:hypothetical protein
MRVSLTQVALLAWVAILCFTGPAWAYLDPGTGSMMLQLLLGGIAGAMVVGKLYWHRFRGFVTSRFSGTGRDGARANRPSAAGPDAPHD